MEEEARDILRQVVGQPNAPRNLGQAIHARFAAAGGIDLPQPQRGPMRPSPDFE
jgi:plasmid stability protein